MILRQTILFNSALLLFLFSSVKAQTFNYSVATDTTGAYAPLTGSASINNDSVSWNFIYKKAIGFPFSFLGRSFDTLSIEKNNYIAFDKNRSYALLAFPGFSCKKLSTNHYSKISSSLTGASPNRIFKIQFEKVGQSDYGGEYINYQVWLNENGRIDYVMGDHTYPIADSATYNDTLNSVLIGLINTNMDTSPRGLFLSGASDGPTPQPVSDGSPDISFLRSMPREGTKYSFIPN
jgi:hypothetical protein